MALAAEDWFDARMERYRRWTEEAAPLVKRLFAPAGRELQLNFLYQDLFFGARAQGQSEYDMLRILSELNQALGARAPDQVSAIIAPTDVDDEMLLRVQLSGGAEVLATCDKPLDITADLEVEVDDLRDALTSIGIEAVSVALRFDGQGQPVDVRPLG